MKARALAGCAVAVVLAVGGPAAAAAATETGYQLPKGMRLSESMTDYVDGLPVAERQEFIDTRVPYTTETGSSPVRSQITLYERSFGADYWRKDRAPAGNVIQEFGHSMRWKSRGNRLYDIHRYNSWGKGHWGWDYQGTVDSWKGVAGGRAHTIRKVKFYFVPEGETDKDCLRGSGTRNGGKSAKATCEFQ